MLPWPLNQFVCEEEKKFFECVSQGIRVQYCDSEEKTSQMSPWLYRNKMKELLYGAKYAYISNLNLIIIHNIS